MTSEENPVKDNTPKNKKVATLVGFIVGFALLSGIGYGAYSFIALNSKNAVEECKSGKIVDGSCVYDTTNIKVDQDGVTIVPNQPAEGEEFGEGYASADKALEFTNNVLSEAQSAIKANGGKVVYSKTTEGVNEEIKYYYDPSQSSDIYTETANGKIVATTYDDNFDLFAKNLLKDYKVEYAEYYNGCLTLYFNDNTGFFAIFYDNANKLKTISLSVPSTDKSKATNIVIAPQYEANDEIKKLVASQVKK